MASASASAQSLSIASVDRPVPPQAAFPPLPEPPIPPTPLALALSSAPGLSDNLSLPLSLPLDAPSASSEAENGSFPALALPSSTPPSWRTCGLGLRVSLREEVEDVQMLGEALVDEEHGEDMVGALAVGLMVWL